MVQVTGAFRSQISATLEITDVGTDVAEYQQQWSVSEEQSSESSDNAVTPKKRLSSGSNIMPIIEDTLSSHSNWFEISATPQYQYPGVIPHHDPQSSSSSGLKYMGHVSDCSKLPHYTGTNEHFLYNENQLSKGHYNDNV